MNVRTPLALFAASFCLAACSRHAPEAARPRPVRALTVEAPAGGALRSFSGTVRPAIGTELSFRVGGEIRELNARLGQSVAAGDVLARLDSTDYDLRLKQLESQLAQTEAQFKEARSSYDRTRELYEASSVSKSDLDRSRAQFESAQAQRSGMLQGLELARQQVDYCTLRAPLNGTVSRVPVEVHNTVAPGQAIIGLNAGDAMEIEVGLPEALVRSVKVGDTATARFDGIPGLDFDARITEVGAQATASTTYPIRLQLQQPDPRVLAGMVGEVSFQANGIAASTVVPAVAVVADPEGGRFVWIFADGAAHRRAVETGELTSAGIEIKSGLSAGEHLIIRGMHQLSEGQPVRLLEE